ncbi:dynamin family protein [Actinomadura viridis]|uniref:dynamin family protein n=1 Tax=Actinomadura viridis TaxID=58110 RepID=UPI00369B79BF
MDDSPEALDEVWNRLLGRAAALAGEHGLDHLAWRLRGLAARNRRPACQVTFAGSFSAGKSHLINQLLGAALLDEGEGPTTRSVVSVRPGRDPDPDAEPEPETEGGAETGTGTGTGGSGAGTPGARTGRVVRVDDRWLRASRLELIDTPAFDALPARGEGGHEARTLTVPGCDAVVLVVRARGGLNTQEKDLLRDLVRVHRIPHVLVVVTMLDLLAEDAVRPVLERARAVAATIGPAVEVLPGPGGAGIVPADLGRLVALRARLAGLAAGADRRAARARQTAGVLAAACEGMLALAEEMPAARARAAPGVRLARERIEAEHRAARARWAALRLEAEGRRARLNAGIATAGTRRWQAVLAEIERITAAHPAPAVCWRDEVEPLLLRTAAEETAAASAAIDEAFRRDAGWLRGELASVAGSPTLPGEEDGHGEDGGRGEATRADPAGPSEPSDPAGSPDPGNPAALAGAAGAGRGRGEPPFPLRRRGLGRWLFEGGTTALDLTLSLIPPLAPATVLSPRLWERVRRDLGRDDLDRQRRRIREESRRICVDLSAAIATRAAGHADARYDDLLASAESWQESWWETRRALWDAAGEPPVRAERLRFEAGRLAEDVAAAARRLAATTPMGRA